MKQLCDRGQLLPAARSLVLVMSCLVCAQAAYAAAPPPALTLKVVLDDKGKPTCKDEGEGPAADANSMVVQLNKAVDKSPIKVTGLQFVGADKNAQTPKPTLDSAQSLTYTINKADIPSGQWDVTLLTDDGAGKKGLVPCGNVKNFPAAAPSQPGAPKPAPVTEGLLPEDTTAVKWWRDNGAGHLIQLENAGKNLGMPGDVKFLVHLPSGNPSYPSFDSLREGTTLQPAIILPTNDTREIALAIRDCAVNETFRIKQQPADDNKKQGAQPGQPTDFALVPIGRYFKCGAGTLSYDLTFSEGGAARTVTSKIRMRETFHLMPAVLLGYDSAVRRKFDTDVIPNEMGENIRTVIQQNDRQGPIVYLGAQWAIGGIDYEDMDWHNYIANLFLAVNPTSPTKDFAVGFAPTLTGGVSLAIGATIHQGTVLDRVQVGDPLEGEGAVPTRGTWSRFEPGFFIGLTVDTNVANAMKSAFGEATR